MQSLTVGAGGQITAQYASTGSFRANKAIGGQKLHFTPAATATAGSIVWTCSTTGILEKYLPVICRTGEN